MKIQVTAIHREDIPGVWTPNTLWPSKQPVTVEVIDADDDPPCERRTPATPGVVAFDGYRIGRKTLAMLRATPGLTVSGLDATNAVDVAARFGAAEKAWGEERAQMLATIGKLTEELARLRPLDATVREQEGTIADLRARLSRGQSAVQGVQTEPERQQEKRR
jgi:hypothetical protein